MTTKTISPYVGELIRKEIKDRKLTNGYLIQFFERKGIKMTDSKFSNKIYGERDQFTPEEISICNEGLGTNF